MKTAGFPISHKCSEKRRALIPEDIDNIKNKQQVYLETGYGHVLGFDDNDYLAKGANMVSRDEVLSKDIICDPKIGDAEYLSRLNNQTIFGWVHAVQNRDITDAVINGHNTAYAWEDMYKMGRHVFWRNNEIAGEAAVSHAFLSYGLFPYDARVAIIGNGNTARGAYKTLVSLGAKVDSYNRRTEQELRQNCHLYDVIVNAILWDTTRKDHIIYREDLKKMRRGSLIIDISCDRHGGIETSIPTSISEPIYEVDGVFHYVVDHTPSLFYKSVSKDLSSIVSNYIDDLIEDKRENEVLENACIIRSGKIIDQRISQFQNR